jgi:hypothetical protein
MNEPYEVRNEAVTASNPAPAPTPPPAPYTPAPGTPYAGTQRVVTRSSGMPFGFRTRQFVWMSVVVVDLILALRFAFIAASANDVGFVAAMYRAGEALAYPFRGIFGTTVTGGHTFQWVDLVAIVIYTVAAWIVSRLVLIATVHGDRSAPVF